MKNLVFGPFIPQKGEQGREAARAYFKFVRDYLVSSTFGIPEHVFDWEARTKYWEIYDKLFREGPPMPIANRFRMPVEGGEIRNGNAFLRPEYHEGVDLNTGAEGVINADLGTPIVSVANGECIFSQEQSGLGLGKTIMIRHRLPEGAEVVSLYGHLDSMGINLGDQVKIGEQIGTMGNSGGQGDSHLHFAIAYGATWDTDLNIRPYVPRNVERTWVSRRFVNPLEFIEERSQTPKKRFSTQPQERRMPKEAE